jgi:hypothetical protein
MTIEIAIYARGISPHHQRGDATYHEAMLRVILTAIAFGVAGLVGGILVPILRDPTTVQGPLLGVLITGPFGFVVGGHLGVLWSAHHRGQTTTSEIAWLVAFVLFTLLFYEFFAVIGAAVYTLAPTWALILTVIIAGLLRANARSSRMQSRLLGLVMVAVLLLVIGLWPPVMPNPWYRGRASTDTGSAHFRSVVSPDLDTRHRVPPLTIDRSVLHLEWAVAVGISIGCAVVSDRFSGTFTKP